MAANPLASPFGAPSAGLAPAISAGRPLGEADQPTDSSALTPTTTNAARAGDPGRSPDGQQHEAPLDSGELVLATPLLSPSGPAIAHAARELPASITGLSPEPYPTPANTLEPHTAPFAPAVAQIDDATPAASHATVIPNPDATPATPQPNATSPAAAGFPTDLSDLTTLTTSDPETPSPTPGSDDRAPRPLTSAAIDDQRLLSGLTILHQTRAGSPDNGDAHSRDTMFPQELIAPAAADPTHDTTGGASQTRPAVADSASRPLTHDLPASRTLTTVSHQIAGEITARAELWTRDGRTDLHIRLEPPELGTVRVHLVASDGTITARLVASDEAARQIIESQLHTLRESLANVGVALQRFDVAADPGGSRGHSAWQPPEPLPPAPPFRPQPSTNPAVATPPSRAANRIDVVV